MLPHGDSFSDRMTGRDGIAMLPPGDDGTG